MFPVNYNVAVANWQHTGPAAKKLFQRKNDSLYWGTTNLYLATFVLLKQQLVP
jgi:hypothetical protein